MKLEKKKMVKRKKISDARLNEIRDEFPPMMKRFLIYTDKEKETIANKKTMLNRFIGERWILYMHENPRAGVRRGRHKGNKIGFGPEKYLASLEALGDLPQQDLAKALGISYGVLRNWSSEKGFKELVLRHHKIFIFDSIIFGFIFTRIHTLDRFINSLMQIPPRKLSKIDYVQARSQFMKKNNVDWDQFSDLGTYSDALVKNLLNGLFNYIENNLSHLPKSDVNFVNSFKYEVVQIIALLKLYKKDTIGKEFDELLKKDKELDLQMRNSVIDSIIGTISQPKISSNEKRIVS